MSDVQFDNNLSHIESLIYKGTYKEALAATELLDNKAEANLTPQEQLRWFLLKSWIYYELRNPKKRIEYAELAYQLSLQLHDELHQFDAILRKIQVNNLEELRKSITQAEQLLDQISVKNNLQDSDKTIPNLSNEIKKRRVALLDQKANFSLWGDAKLSLAQEQMEECLDLFKTVEYENESQRKYLLTFYYHLYGSTLFAQGKYDELLALRKKGMELYIELGNERGIATCNFSMGLVHALTAEFDKSLEYYEKSLKYWKKEGEKRISASVLTTMGESLQGMGQYLTAKDYHLKSLEVLSDDKYLSAQGEIVLNLITTSIQISQFDEAAQYLIQLENIAKKDQNDKFNDLYYRVGQALILEKSARLRDHAKAEIMFKKIISDDVIHHQYTVLALLKVCELLIRELSQNNDPEVIEEIQPLIIRLLTISKNQNLFRELAQTHLLQAKFALIQFDLTKAQKLLILAQQIAEKYQMQGLAIKISAEHDEFLKQSDIWKKYNEDQVPMEERIKKARINEQIEGMLQKQVIQGSEVKPETSVLFLIITEGGVPLLKLSFQDEWTYRDLFGSFISAFNSFSNQFFSESVDRVKIGENIILLKFCDPFMLCYIIKGESFGAFQKLTRFKNAIQENPVIWENLKLSLETGQIINISKIPPLQALISEIFPSNE